MVGVVWFEPAGALRGGALAVEDGADFAACVDGVVAAEALLASVDGVVAVEALLASVDGEVSVAPDEEAAVCGAVVGAVALGEEDAAAGGLELVVPLEPPQPATNSTAPARAKINVLGTGAFLSIFVT